MKNTLLFICCLAILAIVCLPGCNSLENVTNSGSKLLLQSITGQDLEGKDGSSIAFCDVIKEGSVINDTGQAIFTAMLLDPLIKTGTYYQDIIIDQVDIEYSRADGLSIQGKDVPYRFSQKVYAKVTVGTGQTTIGFVLVPHNAKIESPLVELINYGQEHVLKLEAKITFYGKDVAGNRVEPAVGYISVWCANFGDSQ